MTLQQFIKVQGSSFFRKMLYYSKHCKLVGDDEICLPDTKTSFVLTTQERRIYLDNILENLERWFSVIGLEEHFNESLVLFESVFGLNYAGCSKPTKLRELMKMDRHLWPLVSGSGRDTLHGLHNMSEFSQVKNVTYKAIREKLLQDPRVTKWLYADMAIYAKLEELFKKQLKVFNLTTSVIKTLRKPTSFLKVAPPVVSTFKHGKYAQSGRVRGRTDNNTRYDHKRHLRVENNSPANNNSGHKNNRHKNQKPADKNNNNSEQTISETFNSTYHEHVHDRKRNSTSLQRIDFTAKGPLSKNNVLKKNQPKNRPKNFIKKKPSDRDEILHRIESSYETLSRTRRTNMQKVHEANVRTMQVHANSTDKLKRNVPPTEIVINHPIDKHSDKNDHLHKKDIRKSVKNNRHKMRKKIGFLHKHSDHNMKRNNKNHQVSEAV